MGLISKQKTWADNENVFYTDLNADFDTLYNEINGNIDNSNIKPGAGIVESKISFSGSGHGHTGGSDGKLIAVNRAFGFFIAGTPDVDTDLSWNPTADKDFTAVRLSGYAKVDPTGAALVISIYNITKSQIVATLTIPAGAHSAVQTTMTNEDIAQDDALRADCSQVGSTVAGEDISIVLGCTQP